MAFGNGGNTSISTAADTAINNPTINNLLTYSSQGKWANTSIVGLAALPTGGGVETIVTNATATGSVTLNLSNGNVFNVTLTGNTTYIFSGATAGKACAFSLYQKQDSTGSRNSYMAKWC